MTKFIDFRDSNFKNYFHSSDNPQKFILYCAVINRIIDYIKKSEYANFESFILQNKDKDLFLINSESEYVIKNFETDTCIFTNEDYIYILHYIKNIPLFEKEESTISQEINNKFQKSFTNKHSLIEKNNGGIFSE